MTDQRRSIWEWVGRAVPLSSFVFALDLAVDTNHQNWLNRPIRDLVSPLCLALSIPLIIVLTGFIGVALDRLIMGRRSRK